MDRELPNPLYHEDPERFRAALGFAEATSGFSVRLVEKDYYCSVLLEDLSELFQEGLIFKGGTCLSKVHAQFFRLSEDLDFCISVSREASPSKRRRAVLPMKEHFVTLPSRLECFRVAEPLLGHNSSQQYNGRFGYQSAVTGEEEFIKIEISLREPVLLPPQILLARTLLQDPHSSEPAFPEVKVLALSLQEAYAEKIRAALTRRDPAIRDFFDIDNAVQRGLLDFRNRAVLGLIAEKLKVSASDAVDTSEEKIEALVAQVAPQLRPVLRATDYERFDLHRVVALLREIVSFHLKA